jgi:hypothetical protein
MTTTPQPPTTDQRAPPKAQYRVANWPEYGRAWVAQGQLTLWFDDDFLRHHWQPAPTGQRGAPGRYSDVAIQTLLTLKVLFQLPYRRIEGFGRSLVTMLGVDLPIPDHTHLSRRANPLTVRMPRRATTAPRHLAIDATGVTSYGEGEWHVRQHGARQRRTGRKVHLAVDTHRLAIVAVAVTTADWTDGEVAADPLEQVEGPIGQIDADGAYDNHATYAAAMARDADLVVPPRATAIAWAADHPRTQALEEITAQGLAAGKQRTAYHRRSLAENARYRLNQLFGERLASRRFDTQVAEVQSRVAALNTLTALGMPVSAPLGVSRP